MNSYLKSAFDEVCQDAIKMTEESSWYVVLMESCPFYGGPEEGGWYGNDQIVIGYQEFLTEEIASQIAERVRQLAEEMNIQAQTEYGNQCNRELDWCEKRGLDANYLPEPDGPSEYYVTVTNEIPHNSYGRRGYE